jgi:hypothetical protein
MTVNLMVQGVLHQHKRAIPTTATTQQSAWQVMIGMFEHCRDLMIDRRLGESVSGYTKKSSHTRSRGQRVSQRTATSQTEHLAHGIIGRQHLAPSGSIECYHGMAVRRVGATATLTEVKGGLEGRRERESRGASHLLIPVRRSGDLGRHER